MTGQAVDEEQAMSVTGKWRIVEMELWDREAIDLVGPASIEFRRDRTGPFRFVAVEGWMDWRPGGRDGHASAEFTWEGDDDGAPISGRGWVVLEDQDGMRGHFYFHLGDDSAFRAVRATRRRSIPRSGVEGLVPARRVELRLPP